jgi:hypothetical protein
LKLFQEYLIDDVWLPDSDGNKQYKLDLSNTTISGKIHDILFVIIIL